MGGTQLGFKASSDLLGSYDIVVSGTLVQDQDGAKKAAERIGYPVALKAISEKIVHKSDVGAVMLNINSEEELLGCFARLVDTVETLAPEGNGPGGIEGVLVQPMAKKGFELLIGAKQDPSFGPVTMIGLGGIYVELLSDVAPGIGILERKDVERMLSKTKAGRVLDGFRGQRYDRKAVIDLALRVSRLMAEHPEIHELDLNPVMVYERGFALIDCRLIYGDPVRYPHIGDISESTASSLEAIFAAESVAVVGASGTGTPGGIILKNCRGIKKLYPVNPRFKEIQGLRCYASLKEIPITPEVGVFVVNAEKTVGLFEEFCEAGGRGAIIFSDGFAEAGNKDLEDRLKGISERHKVSYIGPNCMGVIDNFSRLNTNYIPEQRSLPVDRANCIGIISQSGGIGLELLEMFRADNLGLGRWVSIGNASSIGVPDMLQDMGRDRRIKLIAIYLEGVEDGLKLMQIGKKVTKKKPVLVIKGGIGGGAQAALSHTASLAGSHEAFRACCAQAGFYFVEELTEDPKILVNILSILTSQTNPDSDRVAVVSVGGGAGILIADQITEEGMHLSSFAPETKERLKDLFRKALKGGAAETSENILKRIGNNPVDLLGNCNDERLIETLRIVDDDPNTDVIIAAVYLQVPLLSEYLPERLAELKGELKKPLIISPRGFSEYVARCREYLASKKIHTYTVPMIKPLSIALKIWKRYGASFHE